MFVLFQVPSAAGPSTRVDTGNTPEVPSSEDVIRLLRIQLEEESQWLRNLEAELKDSQSQVQTLNDREEFLFAELAAQVHDLNCKLLFYLQIPLFLVALILLKVNFHRYQRKLSRGRSHCRR